MSEELQFMEGTEEAAHALFRLIAQHECVPDISKFSSANAATSGTRQLTNYTIRTSSSTDAKKK